MVIKSEFKIVYVAPMKALAAEIVAKFSSRLKYLGMVVNELTGDMQMTKVGNDFPSNRTRLKSHSHYSFPSNRTRLKRPT